MLVDLSVHSQQPVTFNVLESKCRKDQLIVVVPSKRSPASFVYGRILLGPKVTLWVDLHRVVGGAIGRRSSWRHWARRNRRFISRTRSSCSANRTSGLVVESSTEAQSRNRLYTIHTHRRCNILSANAWGRCGKRIGRGRDVACRVRGAPRGNVLCDLRFKLGTLREITVAFGLQVNGHKPLRSCKIVVLRVIDIVNGKILAQEDSRFLQLHHVRH